MRFLVDECTGPRVAKWLQDQGHEVFSIFERARGWNDADIIDKACVENWVLITNDKDFGEKVYRDGFSHHGVILLRLSDERFLSKVDALNRLLLNYEDKIVDAFVVVTEENVRFARR